MNGVCLALGLGLFSGAVWLLAQNPAAKQQTPVLRVTTRLVQINVLVQDKKGEPVPNLTKDDFVVLEDGKEQRISVFSMEASRTVAGASEPAPLPPDTFTNVFEYRPNTPTSVTAVLLDALNTSFEDQVYAKGQLVKFLEQLQPQDRVAIYTLGRSLRVLHDFSSDTESLLRTLARHKGQNLHETQASVPEEADTGDEELDRFLNEANERMANFYTERRVEMTLKAIEAIANHLSRLPGRKNLIWVSGSFPFSYGLDNPSLSADRKIFNEEILRTTHVVTDAGIAIYPVDARGLIGFFSSNPSFNPGNRPSRNPMLTDSRAMARTRATHDSMNELAERTGGRAFYNSNDIKGSIRRAIDDSRITYLIGYYPANANWDGRFRQIKISLRQKGYDVRHRRGYFALSEEGLSEAQRQQVMEGVVSSPLDATEIGLTVHLTPPASNPPVLKLETRISAKDVTLVSERGRWAGSLSFSFVQRDREGKVLTSKGETISLHFEPAHYQEVVQNGMAITGELPLNAKTETIRLIVRDDPTGNLGSITVPVSKNR